MNVLKYVGIIIVFFIIFMVIFHKFGSAVKKLKDLKVVCVCVLVMPSNTG